MIFPKLFNVGARNDRRQNGTGLPLPQGTVADAMTPNPMTVSPDMTLSHIINQVILRHGVSFLPVVEDGILLGKIDSGVLKSIDREHWNSTKANDIFVELGTDQTLSATTSIAAVLEMIADTGQRKFLVAKGRNLDGVLTLADLIEYIPFA